MLQSGTRPEMKDKEGSEEQNLGTFVQENDLGIVNGSGQRWREAAASHRCWELWQWGALGHSPLPGLPA